MPNIQKRITLLIFYIQLIQGNGIEKFVINTAKGHFGVKFVGEFAYYGLGNKILYLAYSEQNKNCRKKKNDSCYAKTEYFECFFYTFGVYLTKVNNNLRFLLRNND